MTAHHFICLPPFSPSEWIDRTKSAVPALLLRQIKTLKTLLSLVDVCPAKTDEAWRGAGYLLWVTHPCRGVRRRIVFFWQEGVEGGRSPQTWRLLCTLWQLYSPRHIFLPELHMKITASLTGPIFWGILKFSFVRLRNKLRYFIVLMCVYSVFGFTVYVSSVKPKWISVNFEIKFTIDSYTSVKKTLTLLLNCYSKNPF